MGRLHRSKGLLVHQLARWREIDRETRSRGEKCFKFDKPSLDYDVLKFGGGGVPNAGCGICEIYAGLIGSEESE